jgi:hypothetical protein
MLISPVKFGFNKFSDMYYQATKREIEPEEQALQRKREDLYRSTFETWYADNEQELKGFLAQEALPGTGYELRDMSYGICFWTCTSGWKSEVKATATSNLKRNLSG